MSVHWEKQWYIEIRCSETKDIAFVLVVCSDLCEDQWIALIASTKYLEEEDIDVSALLRVWGLVQLQADTRGDKKIWKGMKSSDKITERRVGADL